MSDEAMSERLERYYGGEMSAEEERLLRDELAARAPGELAEDARPIALLGSAARELRAAAFDVAATERLLDGLLEAPPTARPRAARRLRLALAAASLAAIAFAAGLWIGRGSGEGARAGDQRLAALEADVVALRRSMVVSLLDSPSETAQLQGAALARVLPSLELGEIDRLTQAVRSAGGVGVRLAALETLYFFSANPEARSCLERALDSRQPPLVQSSWVDLMIAAGQSTELLRAAAAEPTVDEAVRRKILTWIDA